MMNDTTDFPLTLFLDLFIAPVKANVFAGLIKS